MQFNIGDKVSFLHENLNGTIVKILSKHEVEVEVAGFGAMPTDVSEIILVESSEKKSSNQSINLAQAEDYPLPEKPKSEQTLHDSVKQRGTYLVVQFSSFENDWRLSLFNNEAFDLLVLIYEIQHDKFVPTSRMLLEQNNQVDFYLADKSDFSENRQFAFQALRFSSSLHEKSELWEARFKFSAKNQVKVMESESSGFAVFSLKFKQANSRSPNSVSNSETEDCAEPEKQILDFIDLHIEKLIPSKQSIDKQYYLQIQMRECEKFLNEAIENQLAKVTILHGFGQGVLRDRVWNLLEKFPQVSTYEILDYGQMANAATVAYLEYR